MLSQHGYVTLFKQHIQNFLSITPGAYMEAGNHTCTNVERVGITEEFTKRPVMVGGKFSHDHQIGTFF